MDTFILLIKSRQTLSRTVRDFMQVASLAPHKDYKIRNRLVNSWLLVSGLIHHLENKTPLGKWTSGSYVTKDIFCGKGFEEIFPFVNLGASLAILHQLEFILLNYLLGNIFTCFPWNMELSLVKHSEFLIWNTYFSKVPFLFS